MKANVLLDGKTVISDVDVDIHIETRRGLKEWRGSFSVDDPSMLSYDKYQLELADGRSGRILIAGKNVASRSGETLVRFTGTGPLQRSTGDREHAN